jgi:hypothetical protein
MRRIGYVAAAVAACALVVAAFASAGSKDYNGPACNNLTGGDGAYTTFGGSEAFVTWSATTESPTCAKTTYTLFVLNGPGGSQIAAQPIAGGTAMTCPDTTATSTSCVSWTVDLGPAATAPSSVCIYGTSSSGNKVNDRAPDAAGSCAALLLDSGSSGGFGGFT